MNALTYLALAYLNPEWADDGKEWPAPIELIAAHEPYAVLQDIRRTIILLLRSSDDDQLRNAMEVEAEAALDPAELGLSWRQLLGQAVEILGRALDQPPTKIGPHSP